MFTQYLQKYHLNYSREYFGSFLSKTRSTRIISGHCLIEDANILRRYCNFSTIDVQDHLRKLWEIDEIDLNQLSAKNEEMSYVLNTLIEHWEMKTVNLLLHFQRKKKNNTVP